MGSCNNLTLQRTLDRFYQWNVKIYFSKRCKVYAEFIPQDLLIQIKAKTQGWSRIILGNANDLRDSAEKFAVFRSSQTVDLTMLLYATWINCTFSTKTLFS
jgi:IS1 family transposase